MSKGRGKPSGRGKKVTSEDEALWQHFSKSVRRLEIPSRVPTDSPLPQAKNDSRETLKGSAGSKSIEAASGHRGKVEKPATRGKLPVSPAQKKPPPDAFDNRRAKRIGTGRLSIDARLDLHGMRQAEARQALRRFLFNAMTKGHSTVLVITGKGNTDEDARPWDGGEAAGRGILKRMVPIWLREPELSQAVVGFTIAHARHGGEGALYIHVRRVAKARG